MTIKRNGIVYLVGAGPGDPGLITVRGLACLHRAEVLIYDFLANDALLAEAPAGVECIYVGKQGGQEPTLAQNEINRLLVAEAQKGKTVVRLKGGDPFIFGRGGEEALELAAAGIRFEVIPGITAGIAAPAYAGIPVTHRGIDTSFTVVTGHEDPAKMHSDLDFEVLARGGTLAIYMGVKNLRRNAALLMKYGRPPDTPAALIEWATYPRQRTVACTLAEIADRAEQEQIQAPAVLVIGKVVALHETLNWFESRPLFGMRIVVTRSRGQAGELSRLLTELGAESIELPVIGFLEPEQWSPVDAVLARLARYDWVIFTSVNGVDAVMKRLFHSGYDVRAFGSARLCAIGPATAGRIRSYHLNVDLIPPKYVAESIAEALAEIVDLAGLQILLPRAEIARPALPETLRQAGAEVDDIAVYRTVTAASDVDDLRTQIESGTVDLVTFTSSSTVQNFIRQLGAEFVSRNRNRFRIASIGPITSETLRQHGLQAAIEAQQFDIPGLITAILASPR